MGGMAVGHEGGCSNAFGQFSSDDLAGSFFVCGSALYRMREHAIGYTITSTLELRDRRATSRRQKRSRTSRHPETTHLIICGLSGYSDGGAVPLRGFAMGTTTNSRFANRLSPFRYPGGKAFLFNRILAAVQSMSATSPAYVEPFAGGAGAALILLAQGKVGKVHLNDADRCIYAAWNAILHSTDRFVEAIETRPVDMTTWEACKAILSNSDADRDEFELGFATYFLNRTNRSGILRGAGPIGGYNQAGRWKIDARYYKSTMIARAKKLGELSDRIELSNLDGLDFLSICSQRLKPAETFYFIDPPYVQAGSRLYLNTMTADSHLQLAEFLKQHHIRNWLLTYDDCEFIRTAYSDLRPETIEIPYSLQKKRREQEIIVQQLSDRQLTIDA